MNVLSSVRTIIPPPPYLQMQSVGVDISDTSLKYVQFKPDRLHGHRLQLHNWGDIDIPTGVLKRGVVNDPQQLSKVIATVREETGVQMVRVSLPEERAYLFETEIKKDTPPKEVRGMIEFRLEENVPLSPRDAFFDYEILDDALRTDVMRVLVTVYARETIMNYYEACIAAGVMPLSFEVEAQAIARATIPANDIHTHLIVDFGKTRTGLGIVHAGALMYTSTIEIGGIHLSAELRKVLGADVSESQLTTLKNTAGLVKSTVSPKAHEAMKMVIDAVLEEVSTRIDYWNVRMRSYEEREIKSIILCGGSANMKGLPSYVKERLHIGAVRANVWKNVFPNGAVAPDIGRRYSYGYATAVGLGLASYV